jgi:hypothetical protein
MNHGDDSAGDRESRDSAPDPSDGAGLLRCPNGRNCKLRILNKEQMLVQCVPVEPHQICMSALLFGGAYYCRELMNE